MSVAASERDVEAQREFDMWAKVFQQGGGGEPKGGSGEAGEGGAGRRSGKPSGRSGSKSSRRRPAFRKSAWSFLSLVARFMSPMMLLFVLFSVIFGAFYVSVGQVLTLAAASVAGGQREACAIQFLVAFQKDLLAYTDTSSRHLLFFYSLRALDCIRNNNVLLTYGSSASGLSSNYADYTGSPENGLASALTASDTSLLYGAAFGNLCTFLAQRDSEGTFDTARCEGFSGGVLKLGLSALITQYYSTAYTLLDGQLRTEFAPGSCGNLSGWRVPAASFAYAHVACTLAQGCNPGKTTVFQTAVLPNSFLPNASWVGDGSAPPGALPYAPGPSVLSTAEFAFLEDCLKLYLVEATSEMSKVYTDAAFAALASYLYLIGYFIPAA